QLDAVRVTEGPALIIAGPGSGKTTVLTNRIKFLIEEHKVAPEEILVITFSKAAALEMRTRFYSMCEDSFYPVTFGTFHSVFFQIIHTQYHYNTSHILTLQKKRELMRLALKRSRIIDYPENELVDTLLKEVAYYKNTNESADFKSDTNINSEMWKIAYKQYRDLQIAENKIDFEDMLLIVRNLFRKNREVLTHYRSIYKYILIDEYQDINDIQYDCVRMLAGDRANLWVCGDDDQSIYGFRGANPKIMLSFTDDYPNAAVVKLTDNYRSSKRIVEAAGRVIAENRNRFNKDIRGMGADGIPVELIHTKDEEEEDSRILEMINNTDKPYTDIAILLRTNIQATRFADLLRRNDIPYSIKDSVVNPFMNAFFFDILSYLRLRDSMVSQSDFSIRDLLRILNKPSRYLRSDLINTGAKCLDEVIESLSGNLMYSQPLKVLKVQLGSMEKMDMYESINFIRKGIGYDNYMKLRLMNRDRFSEYMENMNWIQDMAKTCDDLNELIYLSEHYEEMVKGNENAAGEGVHLMTYHGSKGLEFDTVILPRINEGVVPGNRSRDTESIEEERRMFYVAMTRAKNRLIISFKIGTRLKPALPSRFINCLLK
ncbi:MAG: ATP-dependent helicase, partial [Lachnospiraceae bacterium]|nr:ATP-dependent helicase [Lachnospiraceae bacterium]